LGSDQGWNINGDPIRFHDLSVPKDDPIHNAPNSDALYDKIKSIIIRSHIVICPTGMWVNYSKWIDKELKAAKKLKIPVLAVNPWGQEKKSSIVASYAQNREPVGWTRKSVGQGAFSIYRDVWPNG
jgi:hypothetical protein